VYTVETSSRVVSSDQPARPGARPIVARNARLAADEVAPSEVALNEDDSLEWFVNLLLAENASKA
jgi:hypothetical protein